MIKLPSKECILFHLYRHDKEYNFQADKKEPFPLDFSQEGIVEHTSLSIGSVSNGLKHLIKKGLITQKKEHCKKTYRWRHFYFPTPDGIRKAKTLQEEISESIILKPKKYLEGSEIKHLVDRTELTGDLGFNQNPPPIAGMVTRTEENKAVINALNSRPPIIVISSVAGSGKTTIASHIYHKLKDDGKEVCWHYFAGKETFDQLLRSIPVGEGGKTKKENIYFIDDYRITEDTYLRGGALPSNVKLILTTRTLPDDLEVERLKGKVSIVTVQPYLTADEMKERLKNEPVTIEVKTHLIKKHEEILPLIIKPLLDECKKGVTEEEIDKIIRTEPIEIFGRKIEDLGEKEKHALLSFAVFYERVSIKLFEQVTGKRLGVPIKQLVDKGFVSRDKESNEVRVHEIIQNAIFGVVSPEERRKAHFIAAKYYRERDTGTSDIHLAIRHYLKAGRDSDAIPLIYYYKWIPTIRLYVKEVRIEKLKKDREKLQVILMQSADYLYYGWDDKARERCNKAAEIIKKHRGYSDERSYLYKQLGIIRLHKGLLKDSKKLLTLGRGSPYYTSLLHKIIGRMLQEKNIRRATKEYEKAIRILKQTNELYYSSLTPLFYIILGYAYLAQEKLSEATDAVKNASAIFNDPQGRYILFDMKGYILNLTGDISFHMGEHLKAKETYLDITKVYMEQEWLIINAFQDLTGEKVAPNTHHRMTEYTKLRGGGRRLGVVMETKDLGSLVIPIDLQEPLLNSYHAIANIYTQMDDYDNAIKICDEGLKLFKTYLTWTKKETFPERIRVTPRGTHLRKEIKKWVEKIDYQKQLLTSQADKKTILKECKYTPKTDFIHTICEMIFIDSM